MNCWGKAHHIKARARIEFTFSLFNSTTVTPPPPCSGGAVANRATSGCCCRNPVSAALQLTGAVAVNEPDDALIA